LLVYLLAATALAPLLTVLLAAGDSSHRLAVQQTDCGIQVVLWHNRHAASSHHHGLAARALTFFAQPSAAAQADHVLQFTRGAVSLKTTTDIVLPVLATLAPQLIPPAVNLPPLLLATLKMTSPRPPPAASHLQLCLRSTVLLI
jgi:hypothetical protein